MTSYYLDPNGSDTASGTTPGMAWKTPTRAGDALLAPGDSLLLARGGEWRGSGTLLRADWNGTPDSPIKVGAYGIGKRPKLIADAQFTAQSQKPIWAGGSHLKFNDLIATVINPYRDLGCIGPDGLGVRFGFHVCAHITGHHIGLAGCDLSHAAIGVNLFESSHHVTVDGCYIHGLDTLWRYVAPGALGALGVNVQGADHEIVHCLMEGNWAQGRRTLDGVDVSYSAPVECYNASRCVIHYNIAREHRKTCEFGKDAGMISTGNVFSYNVVMSKIRDAVGPNVHGADAFGPILDTALDHNTIIMTGPGSQALVVGGVGGASVHHNILVGEWKAAFFNGVTPVDNIYWDYQVSSDASADPMVQGAIVPAQFKVNPLLDVNYIPLPGSPALVLASDGGVIGARLPIRSTLMSVIGDIKAGQALLDSQAAALTAEAASLLAQAAAKTAQAAALTAQSAKMTPAIASLQVLDDQLDAQAGVIDPA